MNPWENDPIVGEDKDAAPWENDPVVSDKTETPKAVSAKPTEELAKVKTPLIDNAVDLMDMVLGYPAAIVATSAKIGSRTIGALAGQTQEEIDRGVADISGKFASFTTPVQSALRGFGVTRKTPSGVEKVMGKVSEGISSVAEKGEALGIPKGVTETLAEEAMIFGPLVGLHPLQAAKVKTARAFTKYHTSKVLQQAAKEGKTPKQTAQQILQGAADKGFDISGITVESLAKEIKTQQYKPFTLEDLAQAYGTHAPKTPQEAMTNAAINKAILPKTPEQMEIALGEKMDLAAHKTVPATLPTTSLVSILDKNRRIEPKTVGALDTLKKNISEHGIKNPVTVTVSIPDNMALITDGNTRVTAAGELGLKNVPVKFEKTEVPFTEAQRSRAKPVEDLGIKTEQIPEKTKTAEELADQTELRRLLEEEPKAVPTVSDLDPIDVKNAELLPQATREELAQFGAQRMAAARMEKLNPTTPIKKPMLGWIMGKERGAIGDVIGAKEKGTAPPLVQHWRQRALEQRAKNLSAVFPKQRGSIGELPRMGKEYADMAERDFQINKLQEVNNYSRDAAISDYFGGDRVGKDGKVYNQYEVTWKTAEEFKRTDFFNKEMGAADKALVIKSGIVLGGAVLGSYLVPEGDGLQGLIAGAIVGFGAGQLPKAIGAINTNWKKAIKETAIGTAYATIGYNLDEEQPIEGLLAGSAIFGLRFAPKMKAHPEDDLINAYYGNIAAQDRLMLQIPRSMKDMIPDAAAREELYVLAHQKGFKGRTEAEVAVIAANRKLYDGYAELAKNESVKMGFIDDYIARVLEFEGKPTSEVKQIMAKLFDTKPTGAGGKSKFTRERKYETLDELEKAIEGTGIKFKTKDIAEVADIYIRTMNRTIENQRLINNLKKATLGNEGGKSAELLTTEKRYGYVTLDNPQLRGYYVNPEIAPSLRFVFDSKKPGEIAQGIVNLSRVTKRMNVLGSFFHAKSLLEAGWLAGMPSNPFAVKRMIDTGLEQWRNAGLGSEVDALMREGLRAELPTEITPQALTEMGKMFDMYVDKVTGKKSPIFEKSFGGVEKVQKELFDKFTWDYLHPGLKVGMALRLMEDYHLGLKGKGMDIKTYRQGVASFVNDTFGGLDWYRVVTESKTEAGRWLAIRGLKPSNRDLLGVAIFAPDWTLSTTRAMIKALPGGAKNPANAMLAKRYAARTAITYATILNLWNYATSGHWIWENDDPTKIDMGDGTKLQLMKHSMEFAEWIRHPAKTFSNKMGFTPKVSIGLLTDEQYIGGPPIESKIGYVGSQIAPFTARAFQGEVDGKDAIARAVAGSAGVGIYGMTEEQKEAAREARAERKAAREQAYGSDEDEE